MRGLDLGLMFFLHFVSLRDLGDISIHCPSRFLSESRSQLEKLQLADRARVPAQAVHVNWYILHKVFSFLFSDLMWPLRNESLSHLDQIIALKWERH